MEITRTPTDRVVNSLDNARRVLMATSTVLAMQHHDDFADEARALADSIENLISKIDER